MCLKMIGTETTCESNLNFKRIETHVLKHCEPLENNRSIVVGENSL